MLTIQEALNVKEFNTFGIAVKARWFVSVRSVEEIRELIQTAVFLDHERLILGGGSNLLFTKDFDGVVIKVDIKGIQVVSEDEDHLLIRCGAGESWHGLVMYTVENGWSGLENLSLIPGSVGAAPVQNIGAYGVELKDNFVHLESLNLLTGEMQTFDKEACMFGYRDSVFKNELKGKQLITHVILRVNKKHKFHLSYGNVEQVLQERGIERPTVQSVSDAIVEIRRSKLPDPRQLGNAGSFFKNPLVTGEKYQRLKTVYDEMPGYNTGDGYKIPAAWLIDQCGWKGKRQGAVGVHTNQPLVLVNYGNGTGKEIEELANAIRKGVLEKFEVDLVPEVNIL
ncbi:MAG: UDP-N-acetylmuramate dehydrogenase [Cyclobacteriaceae bacterium]|nr:UDP-N-acetylmuramate dehydrogenase [Cyclobacteriaceae bacterium]